MGPSISKTVKTLLWEVYHNHLLLHGTETFTYNAINRATQILQSGEGVVDKRVDMAYDAASQMTSLTRYADLTSTQLVAESNYTYDDAGRLTNLTHSQGATTLANYTWVYDAANRIIQFTLPEGWLLNAGSAYFYQQEMGLPKRRCTPAMRAYQWMMEVDRKARLHNQERLHALSLDRSRDVCIFCSHDAVEFKAFAGLSDR